MSPRSYEEAWDEAPEARGLQEATEAPEGDHLPSEDRNEDGEVILSQHQDPAEDEDMARRIHGLREAGRPWWQVG